MPETVQHYCSSSALNSREVRFALLRTVPLVSLTLATFGFQTPLTEPQTGNRVPISYSVAQPFYMGGIFSPI